VYTAIEFETEEGNKICVGLDVGTVKDVAKFAAKLTTKVKGIRKVLPEMAAQKITKVRIPKEA
jgi:orotidine-5'-phosphate decarboxylase